jgi:hypothetical protein
MPKRLINEKAKIDPANKAMVLDQWMTPPCAVEAHWRAPARSVITQKCQAGHPPKEARSSYLSLLARVTSTSQPQGGRIND